VLDPRSAIDLPNREMDEIEDHHRKKDGFITNLQVDGKLRPVIPLGTSEEANLGPFT